MDGETFTDNKWTDKSGNGNDSTHTQNVRLSEQTSAAHGCGASFRYITGRKASASSLVLEKGWPSNDQYTFFHVTRYDGPSRNRIWTNVNGAKAEGELVVGTLRGRSHKFYHNQWIQTGDDKFHRSVSVADIYRQTRSNQIASRAKASWKVKI
jgi:hypothetical protein